LHAATPEAGSGAGVALGSGLVGAADGGGAVAILVGLDDGPDWHPAMINATTNVDTNLPRPTTPTSFGR
jgi:hypothetical protein